MLFKKKFCVLILTIVILFSVFPLRAAAVQVAPLLNVEVSPINAGSVAQYRIYGSYSEYNKINIIKAYFRADTSFMNFGAPAGSVLVNGNSVNGVQFRKVESDGSIEATIYLSRYINSGDNIEILFKKEAGIINPITPAVCYKVRLVLVNYMGAEVGTLLSNSYRITGSAVQGLNVNVDPAVQAMKAQYTVSFATGVRGALSSSSGEIRIRFPFGTTLPASPSKLQVMINSTIAAAVYRDNDDPYVLRVYPSFDIPANYPVTIVFSKDFGIVNPLSAGMNIVSVSTFAEPDWVDSTPFQIFEPQVQSLNIALSPDSIALSPDVKISFQTSPVGALSNGGKIYLQFSQEFDIGFANLAGNVYLQGQVAQANVSGNILQITSPITIPSSSAVEIEIKEQALLKNPSKPGDFTLNLWTDADTFRSPFTVNIKDSFVSEVVFKALYSGLNSANEFDISFKTGPVYTLTKNTDSIILKFDEGFTMPDNPLQNVVSVNGVISPTVSSDVYSLYVITPVDILPSSTVEIKIPDSFGIKNPGSLGEYGITVYTSKETKEISSNTVKITPLPVVEFTVNPSVADGLNGYYRTNPEITLSTSNGVKVFYRVDDAGFAEFKQAFKIPEGVHTVYAYAEDAGGNKGDTVKKDFAIDTTPPVVKIDNGNTNPVFSGSPAKITGSVSEPCTLKINDAVLELKDNLNFEVELNVSEGIPIAIYARDLAGNASTLLLTAHIDNIPPVITFLNGISKNQGLYSVETTDSSYTIQVKLNESGKVFVNNVEVSPNGQTFSYNATLNDGTNSFNVKAVDLAGNESTETLVINKVSERRIILTIGSPVATVGSEAVQLQAAPFIENGTTFVPLRFVSESFGAEVQWNDALKIIMIGYNGHNIQLQVGSTTAFVDNVVKKLEVAPKIVNGFTFVPIRFISETFGADVKWDAATKTVTIINQLQ